MKQALLSLFFLSTVFQLSAQEKAKTIERPKIVVGIVVDQMRWDYLYRYYEEYGNDGFKRLLNKGYSCQNTFINYLPSATAPGHSCIYTGSVPSIHGIAGNNWIDNQTGKSWYCTDDSTVLPIDGTMSAGQMSPRNLLATTITDELKLATNKRSKVFGIALKDRGAILPAGHMADGAFWFDDSTGNFISSTFYYEKQLPKWMADFNKKRWADKLINEPWNLLYPADKYTQSTTDNTPYEGGFKGEAAPVFPHKVAVDPKKGYGGLRSLPGGNTISFEAAKACIAGEHLGKNGNTDFICLSISSTDYVGHNFAPNSLEVEDMYLRLDKELAAYLQYLDKTVGEGNYLVFLSADHGAAHNPSFLKDNKVPAGNAMEGGLQDTLNNILQRKFGVAGIVKSIENYQVYLDESRMKSLVEERSAIKKTIIRELQDLDAVAYVADMEDMGSATIPAPIKERIINGYYRKRSGVIQILMNPGWFSGHYKTGTTHGSWNPYDTHIPLVWYGWHVPQGEGFKEVYMTDISATIAAMLHIQMPSGCIGKVIEFK